MGESEGERGRREGGRGRRRQQEKEKKTEIQRDRQREFYLSIFIEKCFSYVSFLGNFLSER